MADTTKLTLPLIASDQAQKHVTHNESLLKLDVIVQAAVIDSTTTAPPGSPVEGDTYIVAASATGDWTGEDDNIAVWQNAVWVFFAPFVGLTVFDIDAGLHVVWSGSAWSTITAAPPPFPSTSRVTVSGTTLTLDDAHLAGNVELLCTNVLGCTITVPTGLTGTEPVLVSQESTLQVVVAASGTTLNSADAKLKTRVQHSILRIDPRGSNVFNISGDTAA